VCVEIEIEWVDTWGESDLIGMNAKDFQKSDFLQFSGNIGPRGDVFQAISPSGAPQQERHPAPGSLNPSKFDRAQMTVIILPLVATARISMRGHVRADGAATDLGGVDCTFERKRWQL